MTDKTQVDPMQRVKDLLAPAPQTPRDRNVWGIALKGVWLPFFKGTNAAGQSQIASDVLGAPERLVRDEDGSLKLNKKGLPQRRVHKDIAEQVTLIRRNFVAGLVADTVAMAKKYPAEYRQQTLAAEQAGAPVLARDASDLEEYLDAITAAQDASQTPQTQTPEPVAA